MDRGGSALLCLSYGLSTGSLASAGLPTGFSPGDLSLPQLYTDWN